MELSMIAGLLQKMSAFPKDRTVNDLQAVFPVPSLILI